VETAAGEDLGIRGGRSPAAPRSTGARRARTIAGASRRLRSWGVRVRGPIPHSRDDPPAMDDPRVVRIVRASRARPRGERISGNARSPAVPGRARMSREGRLLIAKPRAMRCRRAGAACEMPAAAKLP